MSAAEQSTCADFRRPVLLQASLDGIVAGKSRLDASRWFFEMLVLKTRDYVDLEQQQPYGAITIRPRPAFRAPT